MALKQENFLCTDLSRMLERDLDFDSMPSLLRGLEIRSHQKVLYNKIWDFDGLTTEQRTYTRKWWEGFHIWLLLRPDVLRDWAGVDVETGKIQRLIDGSEVWGDEPEVIREYQKLFRRACFLLRRDRMLRRLVEENGGLRFLRGLPKALPDNVAI